MESQETEPGQRIIFHISTAAEWAVALETGELIEPSLESEGFIHFSFADQIAATAGRHYPGRTDLVLLRTDPTKLEQPIVIEDSYNSGQAYPHLYGPLPTAAVTDVIEFPLGADGTFETPAAIVGE